MKVRDIKAFRVTVTFLLALPMTALANDDLSINGFLSVGASKSDADAVYYEGIVDEISFEPDTVVGVQLSAPVTETVSFTTQLLASGNKDTYDLAADWAYVDFSVGENTSIRAGRVKLPVFMASEYLEVGAAYPWVRPPEEVYSVVPVSAFSGVSARYTGNFGNFDFSIEPYYGSHTESIPQPTGVLSTSVKEFAGASLTLGNDVFTLRAGGLQGQLTIPEVGVDDEELSLFSVGARIDWENVLIMSEYASRDIPGIIPDSEGWYAMLGYRAGKFLPHVTVAQLDTDEVTPLAQKQKSTTVGVQYQLNHAALLKVEWKNIELQEGSAGLFSTLPSDDKVSIFSASIDLTF